MRLIIPTGFFYPSKLGGPANSLYWLAKGLVKHNIDVSVVTSNNYIDSELIISNKWVKLDKISIRYCTSESKLPFRIIFYSCSELIKSDVVLFSSICYLPNFFILIFALIIKKKIIWSPRGELFESALKGNKGKIFYIQILKLFLSNKHIFHATSEEEKKVIQKYFGLHKRVEIIPNYMELPQKINRGYNYNNYLLYLGRIAPIKALDNLLLGLCKSTKFINSNFSIKLAGVRQGEYYKSLEKILEDNPFIKDKVEFIGSVDGYEKFQLLANAYYTLLISHSENFGNVIIESLSQGTPVIASKKTPWKILEESNSGFWIENSPDSIADCINKILSINESEYFLQRKNALILSRKFEIHNNIINWLKIIN